MRAHAQRTTRFQKNEMISLRFPFRSLALHIEICEEFAQIRHGRIGFVALLVLFMSCLLNLDCMKNASRRPFYNLEHIFQSNFFYTPLFQRVCDAHFDFRKRKRKIK